MFLMRHSRPFFFNFAFSIQSTVNVQYNFCWWLDMNCGPLKSDSTALPTEPQPLPHLFANVPSFQLGNPLNIRGFLLVYIFVFTYLYFSFSESFSFTLFISLFIFHFFLSLSVSFFIILSLLSSFTFNLLPMQLYSPLHYSYLSRASK